MAEGAARKAGMSQTALAHAIPLFDGPLRQRQVHLHCPPPCKPTFSPFKHTAKQMARALPWAALLLVLAARQAVGEWRAAPQRRPLTQPPCSAIWRRGFRTAAACSLLADAAVADAHFCPSPLLQPTSSPQIRTTATQLRARRQSACAPATRRLAGLQPPRSRRWGSCCFTASMNAGFGQRDCMQRNGHHPYWSFGVFCVRARPSPPQAPPFPTAPNHPSHPLQFVLLSHDNALNNQSYNLMVELLGSKKQNDGCRVPITWFAMR